MVKKNRSPYPATERFRSKKKHRTKKNAKRLSKLVKAIERYGGGKKKKGKKANPMSWKISKYSDVPTAVSKYTDSSTDVMRRLKRRHGVSYTFLKKLEKRGGPEAGGGVVKALAKLLGNATTKNPTTKRIGMVLAPQGILTDLSKKELVHHAVQLGMLPNAAVQAPKEELIRLLSKPQVAGKAHPLNQLPLFGRVPKRREVPGEAGKSIGSMTFGEFAKAFGQGGIAKRVRDAGKKGTVPIQITPGVFDFTERGVPAMPGTPLFSNRNGRHSVGGIPNGSFMNTRVPPESSTRDRSFFSTPTPINSRLFEENLGSTIDAPPEGDDDGDDDAPSSDGNILPDFGDNVDMSGRDEIGAGIGSIGELSQFSPESRDSEVQFNSSLMNQDTSTVLDAIGSVDSEVFWDIMTESTNSALRRIDATIPENKTFVRFLKSANRAKNTEILDLSMKLNNPRAKSVFFDELGRTIFERTNVPGIGGRTF